MTAPTPAPTRHPALPVEYVVPLRWDDDAELPDLTDYLSGITDLVDVTVVDGSDPGPFERHRRALPAAVRHVRPGAWPGRNRKVAGVVTGVLAARHERVVIADDDVRYEPAQLSDIAGRLDDADLVRPQNVFRPLPWHARWDSARMLINRAFGADYPGTFALRRSAFRRTGGYDGDVLFENLQLIRTVRAAGGREVIAADLCVPRRPPTAARFREQRVRQAYDDFAQPARLVAEALLLPALLTVLVRRPAAAAVFAAGPVLAAEVGRRRAGAAGAFPPDLPWWAPLWTLERAVCVWIAIGARVRGGVRYRGVRLPHATTDPRVRGRLFPPGAPVPAADRADDDRSPVREPAWTDR